MKLLALDISTNAGWAVLEQKEGGPPTLGPHGLVQKDHGVLWYGPYPRCYREAARAMAKLLIALVERHEPDVVVVEETNQGKNRYTQKLLEWIHLYFQQAWDGQLGHWVERYEDEGFEGMTVSRTWVPKPEPKYISTGTWKHALGLRKPKDAKKNDQLLKKAQALAAAKAQAGTPEYARALAAEKKRLGIKGKWNKKMLAVNHVNDVFGLNFKLRDNDVAEAICLGLAYFNNAPLCDGDPNPRGTQDDE